MRSGPETAALEGMMASSAVRSSSRWITVIVSSGHRCAAGTVVCAGHGGIRGVSTLGAEKLWRGGKLLCGEAGKALTLRGLSGECWTSRVAWARLS